MSRRKEAKTKLRAPVCESGPQASQMNYENSRISPEMLRYLRVKELLDKEPPNSVKIYTPEEIKQYERRKLAEAIIRRQREKARGGAGK